MALSAARRQAISIEIKGAEEAARYFHALEPAVQQQLMGTADYVGSVLKARLQSKMPLRGESWDAPGNPTKKRGQATGRARASVQYRVDKPGASFRSRSRALSIMVFPKRDYAYMLGWGWPRRQITYTVTKKSSRTVREGGMKYRVRSIVTDKRYRDHVLYPHPIAPPIQAEAQGWWAQMIMGALNRAAKETNGRA